MTVTDPPLANRSGPLAQIEPPINPIFWDTVTGSDNITREVQWTTNIGLAFNLSWPPLPQTIRQLLPPPQFQSLHLH